MIHLDIYEENYLIYILELSWVWLVVKKRALGKQSIITIIISIIERPNLKTHSQSQSK